ncbi:MAG TPA: 6-phosphogluconolactonase [Stellaceae bacterium]|jgi:6-phosphogluconolactonase|nr:6-phosphogluconolactonase [Stellaceae bacterium]
MASRPRIDVSADFEALAQRVALWITDLACAAPGRFAIALSGGSTPKRLYQLLAATPLREAMPWERVHLFWGDDRFVPWDDPNSNYGMAREAMIAHVPIPPQNVHGIPTSAASPAEAAREYERTLKTYYGADLLDSARPLLDVNLLGMGPDGHTASLFPGKPALDEAHRWAVEVPEPGLNPMVPRVTLTFPVLDSARSAAFVAAGADKAAMIRRVLAGERNLPSARIDPVGELVWFVDRAARGEA